MGKWPNSRAGSKTQPVRPRKLGQNRPYFLARVTVPKSPRAIQKVCLLLQGRLCGYTCYSVRPFDDERAAVDPRLGSHGSVAQKGRHVALHISQWSFGFTGAPF